MPEDFSSRFEKIYKILRDPAADRIQAAGEVTALQREILGILADAEESQQKIQGLEEKVNRISEPPLVHSVLIGRSRGSDEAFEVVMNGQRMDVGLAPTLLKSLTPDGLMPGDEILITQESKLIVARLGPAKHGSAAEVREIIEGLDEEDNPRILVRYGSSEDLMVDLSFNLRTLLRPPAGGKAKLKPGDRVTVDPFARIALEKMPSEDTGELELEEDPKARYEDVAGLDGQIEFIKGVIEMPYLHRSLFKKYGLTRPHGILLHGPPGCGKTMIGAAAANGLRESLEKQLDTWILKVEGCLELSPQLVASQLSDAPPELMINPDNLSASLQELRKMKENVHSYFYNIKGPELLSKWVGEAESRIRRVFADAKRKASYISPVIIFFDEIESMFQSRGTGVSSDMEKTMVPQILAEIDGVEALENVLVIGASNRHELLDPALLRAGRLDIKIRIDRPDRQAAMAIFDIHLNSHRDNASEIPLSVGGLTTTSVEAFESELVDLLGRFAKSNTMFVIGDGGTGTEYRPLEKILGQEQISLVIKEIQELATAKDRVDHDGRRIRHSDIGAAIEKVWRNANPTDKRSAKIVFVLDDLAHTLTANPMPTLPLTASAKHLDLADRKQLLSFLIDLSVDALYSPRSFLRARVIAPCGREYNFALREFVSGALIANVVSRAKRMALNRETKECEDAGITGDDILNAIREEYSENKEQFVANKPEIADSICEVCKRRHNKAEEYEVDVVLGSSVSDRWRAKRVRPHAQGRGQAEELNRGENSR